MFGLKRDKVCECGCLEKWSKEPDHPVCFDPRLNEYNIVDGESGFYRIYYCPYCGGSTPKSRRSSLFAHISRKEKRRISSLLNGIRSERDVLEKFGPPCQELDAGLILEEPEKDNEPSCSKMFRTLVYQELSPVAEIRFSIGEGGMVTASWSGKHIGNENSQQETDPDKPDI